MDVKPWIKVTVGIVLSFMILFMSVGYAALSDEMSVTGSVKIDIPYGLFITEISVKESENVDSQQVGFLQYSTTVESVINKKNDTVSSGSGWWPNWGQTTTRYEGTVTYSITVYNNTDYEYAYRDLYYQNTEYHNSYVAKSNSENKIGVVTSFPNGSVVGSRQSLTFEATYTIGKGIDDDTNWRTLLNYQFGINVNSIDKAADIVHDKFVDILNTTSTYQQLVDVLDDKFDKEQQWTSNYVGNVGSAINNDMMVVETLFAGQLTMIVNGAPQKAWVLIKHEDLDGNEKTGDDYTLVYNQYGEVTHKGCEMTLYMTVDPLETQNGWAPVYATVFTCDRDDAGNIVSDWYKVGDSYYGQANIVGYNGETGGTGSFVTDNWKSYAATYQVTEDYSYSIGADMSIKTLMQMVDQSTINEFQQLLIKAEAMIANNKYAGTGIKVVEEAYAKVANYYTVDENGKAIAKTDTRRVWLIPAMNEFDHVLKVAQDAIDSIEQGS